MCGIVGIISYTNNQADLNLIEAATQTLQKRGPDNLATYCHQNIALGHSRLSIIDVSNNANQPFHSADGNFTIIFNGEIFNYLQLKEELVNDGFVFKTNSDTEVLLNLFIKHKAACLDKLNGFFAFAIYNKLTGEVFIARDRFGIKPLLYYADEHQLIFASELKAIFKFNIEKTIDKVSLFNYFQFNYIPSQQSIIKKLKKLQPGHFILLKTDKYPDKIEETQYYKIPYEDEKIMQVNASNYIKAQEILKGLIEDAVKIRLIADVPLGTFLSGGIDSSIISTIAAKYKNDLNTFSIGYKDHPFFDETHYAELVAKKIGSNHHVFKLSNNDLLAHVFEMLDYIDEPFADSSALAVYILSKETKKKVTVALSGDGADEVFSGYNKHYGEFRLRNQGVSEWLIKHSFYLWQSLPKNRNSKWMNKVRQLYKFSLGAHLPYKERYWRWASVLSEEETNYLFKEELLHLSQRLSDDAFDYKKRKDSLLKGIRKNGSFNDILFTDMQMVLPNDMLKKVDTMSMANSLEVRTPFLDHRVVNFAFSLPVEFKINQTMKKKILQDAFRDELPSELYNRPKHGFEVPLLSWFKNELKSLIEEDLLSDDLIEEQQIFNINAIKKLKNELFNDNKFEKEATIWALIVFNYWWKKNFKH